MKTTITGYPINKNGKVLNCIKNETIKNNFEGNVIKQNGDYLYFRFKRNGFFIYSN